MGSILLLSFALSVDGLIVGLAFGFRKIRFKIKYLLVVAFLSACAIMISLFIGKGLSTFIPSILEKLLSSLILIVLGIRQFINGYKTEKNLNKKVDFMAVIQTPESGDRDLSGDISFQETLLLSIALNIDALFAGIGAGLANYSMIIIPLMALFQFIAINLGLVMGKKITNPWIKKKGYILTTIILFILSLRNFL